MKNKTLDQWDFTVEVIGIEAAAEIGVKQQECNE